MDDILSREGPSLGVQCLESRVMLMRKQTINK